MVCKNVSLSRTAMLSRLIDIWSLRLALHFILSNSKQQLFILSNYIYLTFVSTQQINIIFIHVRVATKFLMKVKVGW